MLWLLNCSACGSFLLPACLQEGSFCSDRCYLRGVEMGGRCSLLNLSFPSSFPSLVGWYPSKGMVNIFLQKGAWGTELHRQPEICGSSIDEEKEKQTKDREGRIPLTLLPTRFLTLSIVSALTSHCFSKFSLPPPSSTSAFLQHWLLCSILVVSGESTAVSRERLIMGTLPQKKKKSVLGTTKRIFDKNYEWHHADLQPSFL